MANIISQYLGSLVGVHFLVDISQALVENAIPSFCAYGN